MATPVSTAHKWLSRFYHAAFRYREIYENRFEVIVASLEVVVLFVGLISWFYVHAVLHREGMGWLELGLKSIELPVFLVLAMLFVSRVLVALRRTRLGYSYKSLVKQVEEADPELTKAFLEQIASLRPGFAPALAPGWSEQASQDVADKLAHQSASVLSERSWFLQDLRWRSREADSLYEWFSAFQASLWRLPDDGAGDSMQAPPGTGYFSVIVPMTRKSAESIRRGWRASDLAEVDRHAVDTFRADGTASQAGSTRFEFLAYLHAHISGQPGASRDESRLVAASIQHVAFLLYGLYGAPNGAEERWNFRLLCESSNKQMNLVLGRLGFVPVLRERDGSRMQVTEARSYAGFLLFELDVENGTSASQEARRFLWTLKDMVRAYAPQGDTSG